MDAIRKDILIGDVVTQYPEVVETLLGFGVHCVGCHVSEYETLEDGFRGHGMSDEQIDEAVKQLNSVLEQQEGQENDSADGFDMDKAQFNITEKAAGKLKEIMKHLDKDGYGLRIQVVAGGCSGHSYNLSPENSKSAKDRVLEKNGAKFYIDKESLKALDNGGIDYIETLNDAGFKIENPNATKSCHCGKSFK